jgi:hypothetical protein
VDADQHISDAQSVVWPLTFRPRERAGYHDVRAQPTAVGAEARDFGVSSHKQG